MAEFWISTVEYQDIIAKHCKVYISLFTIGLTGTCLKGFISFEVFFKSGLGIGIIFFCVAYFLAHLRKNYFLYYISDPELKTKLWDAMIEYINFKRIYGSKVDKIIYRINTTEEDRRRFDIYRRKKIQENKIKKSKPR